METAGQMGCAMGLASAGLRSDKFKSRDSSTDGEFYFCYCFQCYLLDANAPYLLYLLYSTRNCHYFNLAKYLILDVFFIYAMSQSHRPKTSEAFPET